MNTVTFDAVIAGAGIVGAACAFEFAQAGLRVAVVEPSAIGGGATAAGMGHVVVMDDSDAQFALTNYSQRLWDDLIPDLPREAQYHPCGTLWVAADDDEMEEVRRKRDYFATRGVAVEVIDAQGVAEAEPNLRPGLAGGLRVPGDGVVYPPCVARFLLDRAMAKGAVVLENTRVSYLGGKRVGLDDGRWISAGLTVNASGTWAPTLTPGWEVRKRKGHLVITDRYPRFVRHQLIELGYLKSAHAIDADSVAFNVQPRPNGQVLIGSSRQFGAETSEVEPALLGRMIERALEYMPNLAKLTAIRTWTGFRAATPDKLPLIGPCLGHDGLHLATGHEGLGITTSLGTARLLADQVLGRTPEIPWEPYLPSRAGTSVIHA
ncbi:NAD(P)/FAD-dependent oxidoreductase [Singulisphaera sp. PoT]|uniref:NAD(P)/FAD-dependent oxidoreductase n=1 Tax=Singulisphaera sp. PoT TaxID=3411797 RepID=UPI003BF47E40